MTSSSYSHLAPELRALSGGALHLWGDRDQRGRALAAIVAAWESNDQVTLRMAVARVDRAVTDGLSALRLPRGHIREVRIESVGRGWLGQKTPVCDLVFDAELFASGLRTQRKPDELFRTWIHESLHGRQAYAPSVFTEARRWRGYEEGLVEGLAQLATKRKAAMEILESSYPYYVAAYEALAAVLAVEGEELWRALWANPTGTVRRAFADVVDGLRVRRRISSLTQVQRRDLQTLADQVFGTMRAAYARPDRAALEKTWGMVLR